jgi:poly-gamma-glutamate capsule biosynthesis protein CapA/YwtB (metallophosphatase superfamily)
MRKSLYALILCLLTNASGWAQDQVRNFMPVDTSRVKIIFAGDMMGHMPLVTAAYNDSSRKYDYLPVFDYVRSYVQSADLAVVNLEVPLAGAPYLGYPQFSSPDAVAEGLQQTGFDLLITANNHALDRGKQGLERTIRVLDSLHIAHIGTYRDSGEKDKSNPYIVEKNKISIGFLNYTYGTNGYSAQRPNIVNYIDTFEIRKDIRLCKSHQADMVIVTLHWGEEYKRFPNQEQQDVAEFIRKCGADAVLGSHPHVVQTIERKRNATDTTLCFPIVYSVGNFVSNQRERYKDGGIMVELNIEKANGVRIKSCSYLPVWVYRGNVRGKLGYKLIPPSRLEEASSVLKLSEADQKKCLEFYGDTREHLKNMHEVGTDNLPYLMP